MSSIVQQFEQLWESSDSPPDVFGFLGQHQESAQDEVIAVLITDQNHRWKTAQPLKVEDYLEKLPDLAVPEIKLQLATSEFQARQAADTQPDIAEYTSRFNDISDLLRDKLSELASGDEPNVPSFTTTGTFVFDSMNETGQLGRYRLERILGEGAFGRVFLAYDEELQRQVAIKVPTEDRFQRPEDAEAYLAEARTVASLNHPNIVPVHDVGRTEDGSIYVVSKFIDGQTLDDRIKEDRPSHEETAHLLATIAQALEHAHQQRLIHRDIKPANILLEGSGPTPYVADFGLAIKEEDYLKDRKLAGTPAYMSPEQSRGEGHRLDGRSDIFSLGVVLYQLLTGKKPFRGSTHNELLHQVVSVDPQPPRELDDAIPVELERICLKALSKRASDRYATSAELADDLLHWNQSPQQEQKELQIVPKGLRSFDAEDSDFFLDLLPGPRNRNGLPESIQFWKTRIEETDPDKTFSVGLIYGPSGCGKSSLVKAGLLPRLSKDVTTIYIEATPDDTETRILRGLRKSLTELPSDLGLVETFAWLRRSERNKVLIVLDQFEQWLHAHRAEQETELVAALRQCNGEHLQAVAMVRDDFGMAATRFMRELETRILEGHNFTTVDLFDLDHAQKVMIKFGQAFGKLPAQTGNLTEDEKSFVQSVASGLAQDGKVVSVRLALFAEMVKGKPWVPATLTDVGGTEGVGVNFLEETFSSREANPEHRLHQQAAREVLKALLPEVGSDIKGHMRSHKELLEASGYQTRPGEFNDLLRILDGELRLITPTDPEGFQTESGSDLGSKFYQLTHDYLVPSLREWLTRKQRETRQGRAELAIAERSATWNSKPENRQLPSLWQWLQIRRFTRKKQWTAPHRKMMGRAAKVHGLRAAISGVLVLILVSIASLIRNEVVRGQEETRIKGLVNSLVNANPDQLSEIIAQLDEKPDLAAPFLKPLLSAEAQSPAEKRGQLHARLASVSRDPSLVDLLKEELLTNKPAYVGPIREMLRPYAEELRDEFWTILRKVDENPERRFRAAIALAEYAAEGTVDPWTEPADLQFVAQQLVSSNAEFQPLLRRNLKPIGDKLLSDLETIFREPSFSDGQRLSAANALVDFAADDITRLSNLLSYATPEQFSVLYPIVAASPIPSTVEQLTKIVETLPPDDLGAVKRIAFGQRRANAAVTLLRLGEVEKVLSVFEWTDDPEALTQFIFRCRERGVGITALLECLKTIDSAPADRYPPDTRYGLLQVLGEFKLEEIPETQREELLSQIADWYANDPSSGVHGAAGWLLRKWGQSETAQKIEQTEVPYSPDREWFTLKIEVQPAKAGGESIRPKQTFYYTFIVFQPDSYWIGSVEDEPEREIGELRHQVELTRPFAVLDREITFAEMIAFNPGFVAPMKDPQVNAGPGYACSTPNWYHAVAFSRWLGEEAGLSEDEQAYASPDSLDEKDYPKEPDPRANWAPRNWPVDLGRRGFRLPTESEWEVASRSGARTGYGFGSDASLLEEFEWFVENSGKHVHPPRELRPNLRGLFDVHGNLYEWTHDWKANYDSGKMTDPLGPSSGSYRVYRGGCWDFDAAVCRSATRGTSPPTFRTLSRGFRLALSPSVKSPEAKEGKAKAGGEGTKGAFAEQRP